MRRLMGTHRRAGMTVAAAIVTGMAGAALAVAHQGAGQGTDVPGTLVASVAQASWTPITTLTAPKWGGDSAVISVDSYGDFLTAWSGISNTDPNCNPQTQIRIRYRTGKLGPVEQLTRCDYPWTSFPAVASNASGDGVAAWIFNPATDAIQARTISPAGKLGALLTVTPKNYQADLVNVAMSPTGQALVAWHEISTAPGGNGILGRFISRSGALGPVLDIGGATGQLPPVVFDKTGTATVGWSAGGDESMARRITQNGRMGAPVTIFGPKPGTVFGVPRLADDSSGDTFVLATEDTTVKNKRVEYLLFRKWAKSGALGPVITVANPRSTLSVTNIGDGPALAADGKGDAVLAWDSALTTSNQAAVWGRRVLPSGKLGPSVRLGTGFLPKVAVDPAGAGLITWQSMPFDSPYPTKIYGRRASATTGTFGVQLQFTGAGAYAGIAVDLAGEFGVIWVGGSVGSLVQARFGH